MKLRSFEETAPVVPVRPGFRSGVIEFRDLMVGEEGSASNYGLQLVDVPGDYSTPRHRHNFEQVRVMLEGSFGFGPGQIQEKGSIGYFCEGTFYTQAGKGRSTTLLLQIGGPSGQGFMSRRQLQEGVEALRHRGSFAEGVFTWYDDDGRKHNQDSYEAVWEQVHGRQVSYPKPQYEAPILFRPERFRYLPLTENGSVAMRHLGRFNDHGLTISELRVQAGTIYSLDTSLQTQLVFCLEGQGTIAGEGYGRWTSAEIRHGEQADIHATDRSDILLFGLPRFDQADRIGGMKRVPSPEGV